MKYISVRLQTFAGDERGVVGIIFALAAVVLVAAAGIAIDFARAAHVRTEMQSALDSAVLAGVRADSDTKVAAAEEIFGANFTNGLSEDVTSSFTPVSDVEFAGAATARLNTTLAGLLGIPELTVHATSKAKGIGGGVVCILVLDPSASQAFLANSGPEVDARDCELHVKSMARPAAIFNAGSNITTKRICIAGDKIIDNGGIHPNLVTECVTAVDPFAGKLPQPQASSCTYSNLNFNGGNVTLNPGVHCGWINFNNSPNVTFNPGVYVIKNGGWNVNGGNWTGTGVTFYFADQSKIQFNSAVAANITAPKSGSYANLVMYEKPGLGRSHFVFDDSRNMNLEGIMYLPSRDVIFNSGSRLTNKKMSIVVNTLILNQTRWDLSPATDDIQISNSLKSVHLTE